MVRRETTRGSSRSRVRWLPTRSLTRRRDDRDASREPKRRTRAALVEDDGPGIPPNQGNAVFGRFYRVEGGMASGSGLGLSIARELARLMGGDVTLESVASPTRSSLDLPLTPRQQAAAVFT